MRRKSNARQSGFPAGDLLIRSNALAGRLEPAQKAMARALECSPVLRASNLGDLAPFRRAEDLTLFAKGLREAGLPE